MKIKIVDGRGALWQWDTGRKVKITDGDGVKQIHYQNKCFGRSIDVDVGTDGTAIIPDELLQDWHTLTAYAYVTDDTGAYTMVQQDFVVHKRAKPAGYVYTPTDQMTLQTIQAQIGDLADLTTEAKDTLVAAINEAARTGGGAGSMDLRVADGYIQYSKDGGGTWTNLIAVADLKGGTGDPGAPGEDGHSPVITATKSGKATTISVDGAAIATIDDGADGAPGKDGAGMDITGATIGQIAKITAVDSDGVPTAWSPVDMPSGGSGDDGTSPVWTHIRDVELTPDMIEAIVSTTDTDETFGYEEILLEFSPNLTGYFYVRALQNANLSKNVQVWTTNSKYHQMHLGLLNKKLAITGVFRTDGTVGFSNNYGGGTDLEKISMLVFGASSSIEAAFTVKIWGR